ncbi:tripartite tricarboxylate transporter TctB family protein [Streptomyces sp. JV176]|uniref:tripartite tricarboxylate transporter TctB family protein n=1 Tax=Streptomyces sp. JV176 TaxID=858630 RepID=UPI002E778BD6|nr:tripartite tricarboxylate transporter TctB family protein [Streptomyces sp. JV176]MEE1801061.1 tripartite tricarboxylate transporter TctB family protein [Streptomyces sp. JV176]
MTTHPGPADTGPAAFLRRRTGLIIPLLLLVTGVVLGAGTLTMEVPANVASPGPRMLPTVVAVACLVFAVLLGVDVLRRPEPERVAAPADPGAAQAADDTAPTDTAAGAGRTRSNHRALAGLVGTIAAFIALLVPLGWLLSGALLFWGVARALGSRRPVFDLFLSIAISSTVQLAFSAGLGLNLPPGVLAGVL